MGALDPPGPGSLGKGVREVEYTRSGFLRLGAGFIGACGLGLVGCGGESAGGIADLRMTWWGAALRNERMMKTISAIEKEYPKIKISPEPSGGGPDYDSKLATQATGGNAPDVFQLEPNLFYKYAPRNILLGLDEFDGESLNPGDWVEGAADLTKAEGKLLGVPLSLNTFALLYDKTVIERSQVDEPDEDWTWDDFATFANDISRGTGDGYYGTEDPSGNIYFLEVFVRERGKEAFGKDGKLGFSKGDLTDWWTYWDDLRESGAAVPADIQSLSTGDPADFPLVRNSAATAFDFSSRVFAVDSLVDHEIGYTVLPNGPRGSRPGMYLRPGLTMHGYARTESRDQTVSVLDALVNNPQAVLPHRLERGIPTSKKVRDLLEPELSDAEKQNLRFFENAIENYSTPMTIPRPSGSEELTVGASSTISRLSENIAFGRARIDEAVDEFFSEAQNILEGG